MMVFGPPTRVMTSSISSCKSMTRTFSGADGVGEALTLDPWLVTGDTPKKTRNAPRIAGSCSNCRCSLTTQEWQIVAGVVVIAGPSDAAHRSRDRHRWSMSSVKRYANHDRQ